MTRLGHGIVVWKGQNRDTLQELIDQRRSQSLGSVGRRHRCGIGGRQFLHQQLKEGLILLAQLADRLFLFDGHRFRLQTQRERDKSLTSDAAKKSAKKIVTEITGSRCSWLGLAR